MARAQHPQPGVVPSGCMVKAQPLQSGTVPSGCMVEAQSPQPGTAPNGCTPEAQSLQLGAVPSGCTTEAQPLQPGAMPNGCTTKAQPPQHGAVFSGCMTEAQPPQPGAEPSDCTVETQTPQLGAVLSGCTIKAQLTTDVLPQQPTPMMPQQLTLMLHQQPTPVLSKQPVTLAQGNKAQSLEAERGEQPEQSGVAAVQLAPWPNDESAALVDDELVALLKWLKWLTLPWRKLSRRLARWYIDLVEVRVLRVEFVKGALLLVPDVTHLEAWEDGTLTSQMAEEEHAEVSARQSKRQQQQPQSPLQLKLFMGAAAHPGSMQRKGGVGSAHKSAFRFSSQLQPLVAYCLISSAELQPTAQARYPISRAELQPTAQACYPISNAELQPTVQACCLISGAEL